MRKALQHHFRIQNAQCLFGRLLDRFCDPALVGPCAGDTADTVGWPTSTKRHQKWASTLRKRKQASCSPLAWWRRQLRTCQSTRRARGRSTTEPTDVITDQWFSTAARMLFGRSGLGCNLCLLHSRALSPARPTHQSRTSPASQTPGRHLAAVLGLERDHGDIGNMPIIVALVSCTTGLGMATVHANMPWFRGRTSLHDSLEEVWTTAT